MQNENWRRNKRLNHFLTKNIRRTIQRIDLYTFSWIKNENNKLEEIFNYLIQRSNQLSKSGTEINFASITSKAKFKFKFDLRQLILKEQGKKC